MNFIRVWCEYDIGGWFGSNNNEDVLMLPLGVESEEEIEKLLIAKYKYLWDEVCEEGDENLNLLEVGLMSYESINVELLEE